MDVLGVVGAAVVFGAVPVALLEFVVDNVEAGSEFSGIGGRLSADDEAELEPLEALTSLLFLAGCTIAT